MKVKATMGFITSLGDISETMIIIEAANIGERMATVSSFGLRLPNK
jgi:hypothetical protein